MIDNLEGKKFGRLEVIRKSGKGLWVCQCSCEKRTTLVVRGFELTSGNKKSCGCLYKESRVEIGRKSFKDLTGKRFGSLVVKKRVDNIGKYVAYECKCDCGNTSVVKASSLRNGDTKTCGRCVKDKTEVNVGDTYGSWTVDYLLKKNGRNYVHCTCSCGNSKDIVMYNFKKLKNESKECRCSRKGTNIRDLTGMVFGKLTVLQYDGMGEFHSMWRCRCECGNNVVVPNCSLVTGSTRSCGSCNHSSFAEDELRNFCESVSGYKFTSNRSILNGKEIDMYCKELNLGIEYNGSVFHSSLNGIYRNKPKNYHMDKFLEAKRKGVHLISVFDVDYYENKDRILSYLNDLLVSRKRVFARNCSIKKLDRKQAHDFCDKYHLNGHSITDTVYYGLLHDNEIMSVMTFGTRRYSNNKSQYELYRYATKYGYSVVGGASKILHEFELEFSPSMLVSYSDNDYFMGNLYSNLGFKYDGQCSVDYYWYLNGKRLKRESCQVKKLRLLYPDMYNQALECNAKNKEDFVMTKLGAIKVYRSGNTRWVKT